MIRRMIRLTLPRLLVTIFSIVGFVISAPSASFSANGEIHDVKYFFDHIESYREGMPRSMITQRITARGRFVAFRIERRCKKRPCPPGKGFGLRDATHQKYMIQILDPSPLLQELKVNRVYVLNGVLEKGVDVGRRRIFIFNFKPQKAVSRK